MAKVLIVDDDNDIRLMVRKSFERFGWIADEAASGDDAMTVDWASYDVLVLDQSMPGMQGDEFALHVRRADYTGTIVFYSAHITKALERKLYEEVNLALYLVSKSDITKLFEVIRELTAA